MPCFLPPCLPLLTPHPPLFHGGPAPLNTGFFLPEALRTLAALAAQCPSPFPAQDSAFLVKMNGWRVRVLLKCFWLKMQGASRNQEARCVSIVLCVYSWEGWEAQPCFLQDLWDSRKPGFKHLLLGYKNEPWSVTQYNWGQRKLEGLGRDGCRRGCLHRT